MTIAEPNSGITGQLEQIRSTIAAAQDKSLHKQPVTLLAVSKTHDAQTVEAIMMAGQRIFAENRVQEAAEKFPELRQKYPDLQLHLIGPLQSNKAKDAVALFDVIHTVDRLSLAKKLSREMAEQNRKLPCFIQVNTGEEPQKAGVAPKGLPELLEKCRALQLNIIGLMCIPPIEEAAAVHFAFLKKLADENNLAQLSMGMSADYEIAIRYGATHIRIGSAIFGARE